MIELAKSEPGIPVGAQQLDSHPWVLNVQNGTLDLRTGHLRPHARGDLLTKLAPVAYDPEAQCPLWETFLSRIFAGDGGLIRFVQKAARVLTHGLNPRAVLFHTLRSWSQRQVNLDPDYQCFASGLCEAYPDRDLAGPTGG